jgi:hypothetical protein
MTSVWAERQAGSQDQEFTGRTLDSAIDMAHAAGETGWFIIQPRAGADIVKLYNIG